MMDFKEIPITLRVNVTLNDELSLLIGEAAIKGIAINRKVEIQLDKKEVFIVDTQKTKQELLQYNIDLENYEAAAYIRDIINKL